MTEGNTDSGQYIMDICNPCGNTNPYRDEEAYCQVGCMDIILGKTGEDLFASETFGSGTNGTREAYNKKFYNAYQPRRCSRFWNDKGERSWKKVVIRPSAGELFYCYFLIFCKQNIFLLKHVHL